MVNTAYPLQILSSSRSKKKKNSTRPKQDTTRGYPQTDIPDEVSLPGGARIHFGKTGWIVGVIVLLAIIVIMLLGNTILGSSPQLRAQQFSWAIALQSPDAMASAFLPEDQQIIRDEMSNSGLDFVNRFRARNFSEINERIGDDAAYIITGVAPDLLGDSPGATVDVLLPMVRVANTWYIALDPAVVDARFNESAPPQVAAAHAATPTTGPPAAATATPRQVPATATLRPAAQTNKTPTPRPANTAAGGPNTLIRTFLNSDGEEIKLLKGKGTGRRGDWGWLHIVDKHIDGRWFDGGIVTTFPQTVGTKSEAEVLALIEKTLQQKPSNDRGRFLYRLPVPGTRYRILVVVGNDRTTIITAYPEQ